MPKRVALEFAGQGRVDAQGPTMDRLLDVICDVVGIGTPWVSDGSALSDFLWGDDPENNEMTAEMGRRLGVPVDRRDLLVDIADRMASSCAPTTSP